MKRLIISVIISAFLIQNWFAGEQHSTTYSTPEYKQAIFSDELDFEIKREGHKIEAEWNEYEWSDFKYYKLMKSYTNDNPVYPEDKAIFVWMSVEVDERKFDDWSKQPAYYRVCVITTDNGRICSNVEKLEAYVHEKEYIKEEKDFQTCIQMIQPAYNPQTWECREFSTPCNVTKGWKKVRSCNENIVIEKKEKYQLKQDKNISDYQIDRKMKQRADEIVNKLVKNLDSKYSDNNDKIERLNTIITKLNGLKAKLKSQKALWLIAYLTSELENKKALFETADDVEDIFKLFEE